MKGCFRLSIRPNQPQQISECVGDRRGGIIIEVIVASILMASLAAVFLPGIAAVNRQRLSIRDDALVLVELNNIAEKAKWVSAESLRLSEWFTARYPEALLTLTDVTETVFFQAEHDASPGDALQMTSGLRIQISVPSQNSDYKIRRSQVVWQELPSKTGADQ